jgi:hypothetical protein
MSGVTMDRAGQMPALTKPTDSGESGHVLLDIRFAVRLWDNF